MRSSGAVAILIATRCFVEAAAFAMLASLAHVMTTGTVPLALVPSTLGLFGAGLVLVTIQRERGAERRSATIIVLALAAGIAWGLLLPARDPDGLAVLSRMVMFGLLAEAFLWRNLSIARGATRWDDARNALLFATLAIGFTALAPDPIDRGPLALLALAVVVLSALGMSLARSTEELALARGTRGAMRPSSATGVSFIVGVAAVLAAGLVPAVQNALSALGAAIEPFFTRALYLLLLPLGYLAAFFVEIFAALLSRVRLREVVQNMPKLRTPEEDEALLREIERNRPLVFGAVELIIVAVAALVALVLFDRMLRERRMELPQGVTLERSAAEGFGLRETLRGLLPRRRARRSAPRDDGTPAGALRALYWRFLALAERAGAGWRASHETPSEHLARLRSADAAWSAGESIVHAFEDLRYGEEVPDASTVQRARGALRVLEDARRAS